MSVSEGTVTFNQVHIFDIDAYSCFHVDASVRLTNSVAMNIFNSTVASWKSTAVLIIPSPPSVIGEEKAGFDFRINIESVSLTALNSGDMQCNTNR